MFTHKIGCKYSSIFLYYKNFRSFSSFISSSANHKPSHLLDKHPTFILKVIRHGVLRADSGIHIENKTYAQRLLKTTSKQVLTTLLKQISFNAEPFSAIPNRQGFRNTYFSCFRKNFRTQQARSLFFGSTPLCVGTNPLVRRNQTPRASEPTSLCVGTKPLMHRNQSPGSVQAPNGQSRQ